MTDQPKPLTHEELERFYSEAQRDSDQNRGSAIEHAKAMRIMLLVDEVRRLRALVRGAADLAVGSDAWCRGCHRTLINQGHGPGCPIGALEDGAEP